MALLLALACLLSAPHAVDAVARRLQSLSLDGAGWTLTLDPADPATRRIKAAGNKTTGPIVVPGAWEAQGFGEETTTMKNQYIGVGTYSRNISLPPSFFPPPTGTSIWLVIERIQRAATVTVGGTVIGQHTGYLSPFECDVTKHIATGDLALQIEVNATRHHDFDGLQGEEDLETDNTGLGGWGGLGGHVRVELRGSGWIVNPHVQHDLASDYKSATVNVTVEVGGQSAGTGFSLRVTFTDPTNKTVGSDTVDCPDLGQFCTGAHTSLEAPPLWSPKSPMQHTAHIDLVDSSGALLDSVSVRFGVRRLEIIGYHWKLNGKWLYLHGYGDDSIYPMFTSPPLNHSFYKERLKFSHGLGMNFVRHHSHILPIEYFDAACEVGIMISAEFPIAYGKPPDCNHDGGCDPLYKHEWASIITQIRNHPCVFDYTMDNEDVDLDIAHSLYSIAKQLDPSRPVNTADGVWGATKTLANPQDFRSTGFSLFEIPIGDPHQFSIAGVPPVPIIDHEMGNFVSWPLLEDQISRFHHNIKPYWLTPPLEKVKEHGLLAENAMWSAASNRLYLFCWKNKLEALRKTEKISGNEWWLLQDFWTGANGILDTYYVSKHPPAELDEIRSMNGAVQLLIAEPGDNLPLPPNASTLSRAYSSNETLESSLHVSNYGAVDIPAGSTLEWSVISTDHTGANTTICHKSQPLKKAVPQGPGTTVVEPALHCSLPDLGDFQHTPKHAETLAIAATLISASGVKYASNSWRSRVYATAKVGPGMAGHKVYTQAKFCDYLPVSDIECTIPTLSEKVPLGAVFVVDFLDANILQWAARGVTVIFNGNHTITNTEGPTGITIPTDPAVFKTAWWLGSPSDNNMGTVAYPAMNKIAPGMAPDGWADEGWFRLLQGGQNHLLDTPPFAGNVEVLIRSIDLITTARPKALLWQARVSTTSNESMEAISPVSGAGGGGVLIGSGLNLLVNKFGTSIGCPPDYPYRIAPGKGDNSQYHLCYKNSADAKAGSGPCGSWCAPAADWPKIEKGAAGGPTCGSKCPPVPQPAQKQHPGAEIPEAAWLLRQLLEYAYTGPRPTKGLAVKVTKCPGCIPSSFVALCSA